MLAEAKAKFEAAAARVSAQEKRTQNLKSALDEFQKTKESWLVRQAELKKQSVALEQQQTAAQSALEADESGLQTANTKIESIRKQIEQLSQSVAQLENQKAKSEKRSPKKQAALEAASQQLGQSNPN